MSGTRSEARAEARVHGGDLAAARARFGEPSEGWLDLSTGINPIPYPIPAFPLDAWTRLPDKAALAGLEATAASAFGGHDAKDVVAGPGTQALIQLLPRLIPARAVAVLGFSYQEHALSWRASGATVSETDDLLAAAETADVVVVVNPNNPDGRVVPVATLAAAAARLAARGKHLVVDEAFVDVTPDASLVPTLPDNTIILRSFGKTFGLAGVRLGFAVAKPARASAIRAALGPWAVSGPALAIASAAYADAPWRAAAGRRLAADSARLDALLAAAGFTLVGGTWLFRLYHHADAARWHEQLGRAGILTRAFPCDKAWLRFGLPGDAEAWRRLAAALA